LQQICSWSLLTNVTGSVQGRFSSPSGFSHLRSLQPRKPAISYKTSRLVLLAATLFVPSAGAFPSLRNQPVPGLSGCHFRSNLFWPHYPNHWNIWLERRNSKLEHASAAVVNSVSYHYDPSFPPDRLSVSESYLECEPFGVIT
jgi:hypothetical protein